MRLQLLSDVHVEFHADQGASFVKSLDPTGVDVLVVAGDTAPLRRGLLPVLRSLADIFPHVVVVLGNHDYYHATPREVHSAMRTLVGTTPNLHWLDSSAVTIDGRRFLGGTMWFHDDPLAVAFRSRLNDFDCIGHFVPWVFERNTEFQRFVRAELGPEDVVVTHHAPSHQSTVQRFRGSSLTPFFVCDQERLILERQPRLWLHGHVHDSLDYEIGETRVLANPFGYAGHEENPDFVERCLIEV